MKALSVKKNRTVWSLYALLGLVGVGTLACTSETTYAPLSVFTYWFCGACLIVSIRWVSRRPIEVVCIYIGVVLALFGLEFSLRVWFPDRAYPALEYLPSHTLHHRMPESSHMFHGIFDSEPITVTTNADGLRTPYSRDSFRTTAIRIAVLGDSYAMGYGVPYENSLSAELEKKLQAATGRSDIAVLNGGTTSYSPLLASVQFARVIRFYEPQFVIYLLDASDIGDDYKYASDVAAKSRDQVPTFKFSDQQPPHYYGALWNALGEEQQLFTWPFEQLGYSAISRNQNQYNYYQFELEIGGVVETNRFFIFRHPLSETQPYFDATWANVNTLGEQVVESGAKFMFIVTPRFQHWNIEECPSNWEHDRYTLHEPFQDSYLTYFSSKQSAPNFIVQGLVDAFRKSEEFPLVFREDPHWNKKGHRFVAGLLTEYVLSAAPKLFGTKPQ